MANRPQRACNWPRCKATTTKRFCAEHSSSYEKKRGSAASRGYDRYHQRWRRLILTRDPLCVACKKEGRTEPSVVADHIVPISRGGERFRRSNGQGLCVPCHNRKSALENHR